MKKMTAWLLALLMMVMPFAGLAEADDASVPATALDLASFLSAEEVSNYYDDAIAAGRRVTTTLTLSNVATDFTGEAAVDQVIADVLNALNITVYQQGDETYFAIGMKQESGEVADLLTMGFAMAGDDGYFASNLIGGTIVLSADEVVPVCERLMDMFVMIGFIEEEAAEELKAELPELIEQIKAEYAAAMDAATATADIDILTMNYTALTDYIAKITGKVVVSEVTMQPKNSDPAVSMATVTLTPAEMNEMLAAFLQFIKDNPDFADAVAAEMDFENTFAMEFSGVAGETVTFTEFLDQLIEESAKTEVFSGDVVYRIWLGEDGIPVAMDAVAPMAVEEVNAAEVSDAEEAGVTVSEEAPTQKITLNYTRLTLNDGVAHSAVVDVDGAASLTANVVIKDKAVNIGFAMAEAGETLLDMKIDVTNRSAENLMAADVVVDLTVNEATVGVSAYTYVGDEVTTYPVEQVENASFNVKVAFTSDTVLNGVDFVEKDTITISVKGKDYCTINAECLTSDFGASIMTGKVVRPAELSDADFANWFVGVYNSLYSWAGSLMYALPTSFMNLMTTGY